MRLLRVLIGLALGGVLTLGVMAWLRAQTFPIAPLATRVPERTALMRQRQREAAEDGKPYRIDRRWVPYAHIAPALRRAVLVAEDDAFFSHGGLDWNEMQAAARENWEKKRVVRGGSTITQQLAKNLYLGDARTPTRKLTEIFLALRLERELSKRRIFELYLNSIEWGQGIFGIEAAARRYFHVPAAALDARQSMLLAAVIINPRRFSVLSPDRRITKRVRMIAGRLRRRGFLDDTQYRLAIGAPPPAPEKPSFTNWFFGSPPRPDTAPSAEPPSPPDTATRRPTADSLPPH